MRGIGEFENGIADDLVGRDAAELALVGILGNDGQLLDDVPVEMLPLHLLPSQIVVQHGVQVGDQSCGQHGGHGIAFEQRQRVSGSASRHDSRDHRADVSR